jgi:hypothetical protein
MKFIQKYRKARFADATDLDDSENDVMAFPERCNDNVPKKFEEVPPTVAEKVIEEPVSTTLAVVSTTTTTEAPQPQTTEATKVEPEPETETVTAVLPAQPPKKYRITFVINNDDSGVPTKLKSVKVGTRVSDGVEESAEEAKSNRKKALSRLYKLLMASVNSPKSDEEVASQPIDGKFEDIVQKEEDVNCKPQVGNEESHTKFLQEESPVEVPVVHVVPEHPEIPENPEIPEILEKVEEAVLAVENQEKSEEKPDELTELIEQISENLVDQEEEVVEIVTQGIVPDVEPEILVATAEPKIEENLVDANPQVPEEELITDAPEAEYTTQIPTEISVVTSISILTEESKPSEPLEPPKDAPAPEPTVTEIPIPIEETTLAQLTEILTENIHMKFPDQPVEEKEDPDCTLLVTGFFIKLSFKFIESKNIFSDHSNPTQKVQ